MNTNSILPRDTFLSCSAVVLATVWALACAAPALGAAFQVREDSAVSIGTAFAGSASSAQTPGTVFDNPAGMTQLPGLQVQLGATALGLQSTFHGGSTNAFGNANTGFDNRNGGNAAVVPSGFVTYRVTPEFSAGLALNAPFGLSTSYGTNFIGRYQAEKSALETINVNPSAAYKVLPWLSLGAGLSAQYGRGEFTNALNSSAIASQLAGRQVALPDGDARLRGDDWSFGYNFGVLVQPGRQTNVGVAYRSRVQHQLTGTVDFVVPTSLAGSPALRSSGGSAKIVLPDTATVSLTQGFGPAWTGYAEVSWTNWSQFKTLTALRTDGTPLSSMPEHYHDSYFAALGASYKVNEQLTLRSGTAFDKAPVSTNDRTARIPDQNRIWLALGVSVDVVPQFAIDVGYAHVFVKNSSIRETSSTGDILVGSYKNSLDIGSVGTRLRF